MLSRQLVRTSKTAVRQMATAAKDRPLSPHLQIYVPKINMITSVIFRGTGIAMAAGIGAGAILYIPATHDYKYFVYQLQQYPLINAVVKFGVSFTLSYHLLGGLRHLAWDNIYGNNWKWMKKTGFAAVGAASAISLVCTFTEFEEDKKKIGN